VSDASKILIPATQKLARDLDRLKFPATVAFVYKPLSYAWQPHAEYLRRHAAKPRRILFLGMNPGPFGMAQTGVPFGEVAAVRDWLGIQAPVSRPTLEHPRKPVLGFDCPRSEVSGKRLWGLFAERFGTPDKFFADHFVYNYCPLLFLDGGKGGKNLTPDKFSGRATDQMLALCDAHLRLTVETLDIEVAIGVGGFAEERLREVFGESERGIYSAPPSREPKHETSKLRIGRILHPSPASPAANKGWSAIATRELEELGVW